MVKKKNVCILKFNVPTKNGQIIEHIDVGQKTLVITENFDNTKIIGTAINVIAKEDGLYADLEYIDENKLFNNAYPAIKFDKEYDRIIINSEIVCVSVGHIPHGQKELDDNLK